MMSQLISNRYFLELFFPGHPRKVAWAGNSLTDLKLNTISKPNSVLWALGATEDPDSPKSPWACSAVWGRSL